MPCLKKLVCFDNLIEEVEGLSQLGNLQHLNLGMNKLARFPMVELKQLRELVLSFNELQSLMELEDCEFGELEIFMFEGYPRSKSEPHFESMVIPYPLLRELNLNHSYIKKVRILSPQVELLECSGFPVVLDVGKDNLKHLSVNGGHSFYSLNSFFSDKQPKLEYLSVAGKKDLNEDLPILRCERLLEANFLRTHFNGHKAIEKWETPLLEKLQLDKNKQEKGEKFPIMNFPNLRELDVGQKHFESIENLEKSCLLKLQQLHLKGKLFKAQQPFPKLFMPELQHLALFRFSFTSSKRLGKATIPNLQMVTFDSIEFDCFPKLALPLLSSLEFRHCSVKSLKDFSKSDLPAFKKLVIESLSAPEDKQEVEVDSIPFASLEALTIHSTVFKSCSFLSHLPSDLKHLTLESVSSSSFAHDVGEFIRAASSNLPRLETLVMRPCHFHLPVLRMPFLKEAEFEEQLAGSLENLGLCELPVLEVLKITKCSALADQMLPELTLPALKHLDLRNTNISAISSLSQSHLGSIESISLDGCPIEFLPTLNFKTLLKFSLEGENGKPCLEDISALAFWNCPSLLELNLSRQQFTVLPKLKFPSLRVFKFSAETIEQADAFENSELPNWSEDEFTGPLIPIFCKSNFYPQYTLSSSIVQDISPIVRLKAKKIAFSSSYVKELPFECFNNFETAKFSNCSIQMILPPPKGYVPEVHMLKDLNLGGNEIEDWPDWPCRALQSLNLDSNQLREFKCQEGHLEALEYLNLSRNQLVLLELNCENLRHLELQDNQLQALPPLDLERLELLELEANRLNDLKWFEESHLPELLYASFK